MSASAGGAAVAAAWLSDLKKAKKTAMVQDGMVKAVNTYCGAYTVKILGPS